MKSINWRVRLKNKNFWVTFISCNDDAGTGDIKYIWIFF